jgi:broad specificity phosphatase PhoE
MGRLNFITLGLLVSVYSANGLFAQSEIYLIRHAQVELETPGWISYKTAIAHKQTYNHSPIMAFEATDVLAKIDHYNAIDTVFVSPQSRARETAAKIFGNHVHYRVEPGLKELDYPVVRIPVLIMPTPVWLGLSRATWMMGLNNQQMPTLKEEMHELKIVADELIDYAERNQRTVVVAHGMVNRQLKKILKQRGWRVAENEGHKNLAVNKLVLQQND